MKGQQRLANRLADQLAHGPFLVEFHLALGGMNVHVHGGGIDLQEETTDRVTSFHQRGVVAFDECEVQTAVLHRAPIHEKMLVLPRGPRHARLANESPQPEPGRGVRRS